MKIYQSSFHLYLFTPLVADFRKRYIFFIRKLICQNDYKKPKASLGTNGLTSP